MRVAENLLQRLQADLGARYQVERELRSGGMATVYVAQDLRYGRRVAIKLLRPELAAAIGRRFLQEIDIAARLNHAHILPLYDSGEAADSLFYVMPFIPGESLRERLSREGQLPVEEAVRIARDAADALAYAHANGIIHRDIKPGNILLSPGHAIVADFGIARAVSAAGGEALSSAGLVLGTPTYMSPEQSAGDVSPLDGRSDIYSLGVVLYEMLAGAPPFTAATPQAVIARHHMDQVPSLRTVRDGLPAPVEDAVLKALAKAPADRHPTAQAFSAALGADPGPSRPPARTKRPSRLWAALIAVGLVLTGAAVLWELGLTPRRRLDPHRIVVYPLVVGGRSADRALVGEDATTAAVAALNSTQLLKGYNGWRLLSDEQRAGSGPSARTARRLARESGAGYYVDGRIIPGDSTRAVVELHDLRGDSTFQRTITFRPSADAWTVGVAIARDFLPLLIGRGQPVDLTALGSPNPAAAEGYLLGDRAYRRGHFREASAYFRRAVESDSSFAIAAVMGAQAAGWGRLEKEATSLLRIALDHKAALGPRYGHYLNGLWASWAGRADSAVTELRAALALDPNWPEAWAELGEVYSHWLPTEPAADSLQGDAFERADSLDAAFVPALYHLVEIALRRGDVAKAKRLVATMEAAGVDSTDRIALGLMVDCVGRSPRAIDWRLEARHHPLDVADVGSALAVAGLRQPGCAEAAWSAILQYDSTSATEAGQQRRFRALEGLHGLLVAEGRYPEAQHLLDAETRLPRVRVWRLQILAITAGSPDGRRVAAAADSLYRAAAIGGWPNEALWSLGIWEAHRRNGPAARALANRAAARPAHSRADSLLARSLEAWAALAQGDTAQSLRAFDRLVPTGGSAPWEDLGPERVVTATLHLARGEYADAFRIASLFDAPGGVHYLMYLWQSLGVRARAARAMGNERLAAEMDRRLALLDTGGRGRR
jgi:eukaryotic-like serine/threonine-protein kinase